LAGLSNLYRSNVEKLDREKKNILKKAKEEADEYLKGINKKIEHVIKELKESSAKPEIIKSSQNIIKELKSTNKNIFKEEEVQQQKYEINAGDYVQIKNTETTGRLTDVHPEKNKGIISVGSLKMQVSLDELIPAKKE